MQDLFEDSLRAPTELNNPYSPEITIEDVIRTIKHMKDGDAAER